MKEISSALEMQQLSRKAHAAGKTITFVPTMGALHEGHLSLMREARRFGDLVVVSIFVNPKQFNDLKDFEKYSRDLPEDLKKCEEAAVDVVFAPSVDEMYPANDPSPELPLPAVAKPLEGASRPGHFEGVVAVVSRLFRIVQPQAALFGLKDYQQVRVLEEITKAARLPVTIIRHPTVREKDGLAMSSRNVRLSPEGRQKAALISKALKAAEYLHAKGERNPDVIRKKIEQGLIKEKIQIDYVSVVDADSLEPIVSIQKSALVAIAVFIDGVRLIDNCVLL